MPSLAEYVKCNTTMQVTVAWFVTCRLHTPSFVATIVFSLSNEAE